MSWILSRRDDVAMNDGDCDDDDDDNNDDGNYDEAVLPSHTHSGLIWIIMIELKSCVKRI